MLVELDDHPSPGAQGLECAVAELEAPVIHAEMRLGRGNQAPIEPHLIGWARARHYASTAPMALRGPRALATVSSHSAEGSLRHVMPPPTCSVSLRPSATKVRIAMLVAMAPSGPIHPIAPV